MRFYGRKNYPVNLVDDAVIGCASAPLRPDRHSRRRAEKPHGKLESRPTGRDTPEGRNENAGSSSVESCTRPAALARVGFSFVLPET